MRLARSARRFVGIELQPDHLRVASLESRRDCPLTWSESFSVPLDGHRDGATFDSPEVIRRWCTQVADVIPRCNGGCAPSLVISPPSSWFYFETIQANQVSTSVAACDTMFRHSVFRSAAYTRTWLAGEASGHVMLVSIARDWIIQLCESFSRAGYDVHAVLPPGLAITMASQALMSVEPLAVAYLSRQGGSVTIRRPANSPQVNEVPCGLSRPLPAPRRVCERSDSVDEVEAWLTGIAQEINATISYARRLAAVDDESRPVVIAGDLACFEEIDLALATRLHRPVAVWNYANWFLETAKDDIAGDVSEPTSAVATSLAFVAWSNHTKNHPLRSREQDVS